MPEVKPNIESFAKIKVVGVGGGGCNAISRMVGLNVDGVDFIAINTDAQILHKCKAPKKILSGKGTTNGRGAGMNFEVGLKAAEESRKEVEEALKGADMIFITCGLGGGTGTPGAPVIADIARSIGALTVAVVTKPFSFEGKKRAEMADRGLAELEKKVDSLIVIPNDRVLSIIDNQTPLTNAFEIVDNVLSEGVRAISDLIVKPGLINVDFADIKTIMQNAGWALMGVGRAQGENRIEKAASDAIHSPLLEVSIDGATGLLFNISGGEDLAMKEIDSAARIITKSADPDARVIFGAVLDKDLKKGEVKVTVIATGFRKTSVSMSETIIRPIQEEIKPISAFDEAVARASAPVQGEPQKQERPKVSETEDFEGKATPLSSSFDDGADEWDIPAFLRKKKK